MAFTQTYRVSLGCLFGVLAVVSSSGHCAADDSIWKTYQATALEAESKEEHVLAERAWRAAVAEIESVAADDSRKFISLAHLALAQVERELPDAEATISRAENAYKGLTEKVPAAQFLNPVQQANGLWKWARAKKNRTQRYSGKRADLLDKALEELAPLNLPPVRLAQLAFESSLAQRDVGHPAAALRQSGQAIDGFRSSQVNNHRLANALLLRAMLLIELSRPDEAPAILAEWLQIDERLEAEKAPERPARADYQLAWVLQSISRSDWATASQQMTEFGIGTAQESLPVTSSTRVSLVTRHNVLTTAVEIHLALGQTSGATLLIDRLKHEASAGTLECGEAVALEGELQLALGDLSMSVTRLEEARSLISSSLGDSHPRLIPVLLLLATIRNETGEFDGALSLTTIAMTISSPPPRGPTEPPAPPPLPAGHPLSIEALAMWARIELRRQHGDEARQFARQAWTMSAIPWPAGNPHEKRILALLAEAEAQIGSPDAAGHLETLEVADVSALPPQERGFVDLHRARAAHFLNQPGQARSHYQNAIHSWGACQTPQAPHPFSAPALLGLAIIEDLGKEVSGTATHSALGAMKRLLGSETQVAKELSTQGNAFFTAGRHPESIWLYSRAIEEYTRVDGAGSTSVKAVEKYRKLAEEAMNK